MNATSKRKGAMEDDKTSKRAKKECSYGEGCYRRNPAHLREYSHPHLDAILDNYSGQGAFPIPPKYSLQRTMIMEQLEVIVEKKLYEPANKDQNDRTHSSTNEESKSDTTVENRASTNSADNSKHTTNTPKSATTIDKDVKSSTDTSRSSTTSNPEGSRSVEKMKDSSKGKSTDTSSSSNCSGEVKVGKPRDPDYRPIVQPTRRAETFLKVVRPRGKMAAKHAASAPYHVFYTTIDGARETHDQPYSITFLEILDHSLGELKCSLQINFMVEVGWLLAQYYFAGYSEKRLTILYGEDMEDLRTINKKKPQVDAHHVSMATPFGKHHTKMMILCYEDGSLRVVVSTANLYIDDWENRTQGLWFSPQCPELAPDAMPHDGESPTMFKRCLIRYLNHYHMPQLSYYVERVKRCDFSHINVFLVASAPGSHFDQEWSLTRVSSLLRQHCCVPRDQHQLWPLLAQASSIGSYGKEPKLWLTGDFLHHFTRSKNPPQVLSQPPKLKVIYPSLENVRQSHDGLLGGGCLPYAADAHTKQMWLKDFLYQWKATSTHRDRAMPHIKCYTRTSPDNKMAAFYLLTSANVSKAAWGVINKGNAALRVMSYEAGVLFLPRFVINEDFFPLDGDSPNRLVLPYDVPPTKYTSDMSPWVSDYLR